MIHDIFRHLPEIARPFDRLGHTLHLVIEGLKSTRKLVDDLEDIAKFIKLHYLLTPLLKAAAFTLLRVYPA